MHWNNVKHIIVFLIFFTLSFSARAADTYILDPLHSYVSWHINHFGFSNPSGKWMAQGTLVLDKAHPEKSSANVTIHVADMITGIPELDKHLKGKLFFDVAQYPTATFVSNKVTVTGKNTAKVSGILTLRGISKPETLDVTLNKVGINPIDNKMRVGFSAVSEVKRSDFAITTLLPGLSDDVKLHIEIEASYKSSDK